MEPSTKIQSEKSLFSRIYFCWIWSLLKKGNTRSLYPKDIPSAPLKNTCKSLGPPLIAAWYNAKIYKTRPSLVFILHQIFWKEIWIQGLMYAFSQSLQYVKQYFIMKFTHVFGLNGIGRSIVLSYFLGAYGADPSSESTIGFACILILISALNVFTLNPWNFLSSELGLNMSNALIALIYHKSLCLSAVGRTGTDQGQLVNLMSNDVKRLETRIGILHALWLGPVVTIISAILLWWITTPEATIGLLALAIILPISSGISTLSSQTLAKISILRDARLKLLDEIVTQIKNIKIYCYEQTFINKIAKIRKNETNGLIRRWNLWALYRTIYITSPRLIVFLALLVIFLTRGTLHPKIVFVIMCLYNIVISLMSQAFPSAIFMLMSINVSMKRIEEFLMLDEDQCKRRHNVQFNGIGVCVQNYSARRHDSDIPTLTDVSLTILPGKPILLLGPTGSGKSALLAGILGELKTINGSCDVNGSIAIASQQPWTFSGTIRENITFGLPMRQDWYNRVVDACALSHDISTFPNKDLRRIGDKEISISGGQKARINLARAVYAKADIYLLDDILSAVDVNVKAHIVENVIFGILRKKCVIMTTTNDVGYFENYKIQIHSLANSIVSKDEIAQSPIFDLELPEAIPCRRRLSSRASYGTFDDESAAVNPYYDTDEIEESSGSGVIGMSHLFKYLNASKQNVFLAVVVTLFVLFQLCQTSTDLLLILWTSRSQNGTKEETMNVTWAYGVLILADVIVGVIVLVLFYRVCTMGGTRIHQNALSSVIRTSIDFFNLHTTGAILNRFSMDMGAIDEYLPQVVEAAISSLLQVLGIVIVASVLNQILILPALFLVFAFLKIRKLYVSPSSDMRRIEAISRTPFYTHVNSTFSGLQTIRLLHQEEYFTNKMYRFKDNHTASYYAFLAAFNWFIFYMDLLVLCFSMISIICFLEFPIDTASAGLAMSLIFSADNIFSYGMQQTVELGNELVSVERLLEYGQLTPETHEGEMHNMPWSPSEGRIRFNSVTVEYVAGVPILSNINLAINPGEKVAIVGRTGAGKSTLLALLLGLVKPSRGSISIDGVDIRALSLLNLRTHISVISQSTALFHGTLRNNLDINQEFEDTILQNVLNDTQLLSRLGPDCLDTYVDFAGANFSQGEKQLISLARALLRKTKILLLDEATANIDDKTEEILRNIVESRFQNSTIIGVAHNLDRILHYDKICVLENGSILEYDATQKLLEQKNSKLSQMLNAR